MKIQFKKDSRIALATALTVFIWLSAGLSAELASANQDTCNIEDSKDLLNLDWSGLQPKEIKISGKSTEGGTASVFVENGNTVFIKADIFGETSRTEIKYYFDAKNSERILVELATYHYVSPIYESKGKTASVQTASFTICKGQKPNYPNSYDLEDSYQRALTVLNAIKY